MTPPASAREEIDRINASLMSALRRADVAGIAAGYWKDAEIFPPGGQIVRGAAAIEEFWQSIVSMGVASADLVTLEFEQHDDTAWEIGQATLRAGYAEVVDILRYLVIWKREDRTWKIHRDIWNSSRSK